MKRQVSRVLLALVAATAAYAHFVFGLADETASRLHVVINEELKPSLEVGVNVIEGTKLTLRDASGTETPLKLVKEEHTLTAELPGPKTGTRLIQGVTDLGLTTRGAPKPYLLIYYPKTVLGNPFDKNATTGGDVPVEIIPRGKPGAVSLELVGRGKPLADTEFTVIFPDGKQQKVKTNGEGRTDTFTQSGRYGAWARFFEPASGERKGTKYEQVRNYAMLVFDVPFASLPQATASFGSVASDGWLYVYGGHVAPTHVYFKEGVSGRFDRMRLTGEPVWESLPGGPGLQGMNLAAHAGKIYRIGGMAPQNEKNKAADIHSIAECARFDPASKTWEPLPALPEPRSSHDVVVIGDQLVVTGGWILAGPNKSTWLDTTLVMDLKAKPLAWRSVKQPFRRRALMAAAHYGRMYVIGGINDQGKVGREVAIYDPRTETWSDGPALPEGQNLGFGPAAGVHQGRLYVSVANGTLLRLDPAKKSWEEAGHSTPRVAHRLASHGSKVLVIGGAAGGKNSDLIEAVQVR